MSRACLSFRQRYPDDRTLGMLVGHWLIVAEHVGQHPCPAPLIHHAVSVFRDSVEASRHVACAVGLRRGLHPFDFGFSDDQAGTRFDQADTSTDLRRSGPHFPRLHPVEDVADMGLADH